MAIKDPQYSSSAQPCGSGQQVVYAWALNAPELELPDNVGFRVGGPDSEIDWLVLQVSTGKSLLEALILASTNPQYDKRLFVDLPVQYMKTTSSEHLVYINCFECQKKKTICVHNMF